MFQRETGTRACLRNETRLIGKTKNGWCSEIYNKKPTDLGSSCWFIRCFYPSSVAYFPQTRHRVRKLNSALTLTIPRSRNRLAFICSFRMPKVGSLISCRRLYRLRAASVSIHCRCLSKSSSEELIQSARPACLSLVQTPKAGQVRQSILEARYTRYGPDAPRFERRNPRKRS